jgi:intraflagellar transport protein 122
MTGSNKKATLYSREGAKLTEICMRDSWLWCCDCNGEADVVALGSHHGGIDFLKMNFDAVHALFRDRYAYRENLTEVIVHHLVTDKKVRIKCKDLIQNLSLYRNKLAVQLSDRVCIYESSAEDAVDMHFRLRKEKILISDSREGGINSASNLMVVTGLHLLFSSGHVVELYSFDGQRQKVWTLESPVNCMRLDGGPEGKEGVLLGLQSGAVLKIYIDNPFPLEVTKRTASVIQLDINIYRTVLTTVDVHHLLHVTDLHTQEVLFSAPGVLSACFNSEVADLICITAADSSISVISGISNSSVGAQGRGGKSSAPELQEQHLFGHALGFRGQKIFCLYRGNIVGVDVPQGTNMQRALEGSDFSAAYKIACLGATEADWKLLAMRALRANQLSIAKNAFARLKDTKFLSLIDTIERRGVGSSSSSAVTAPTKSTTSTEVGSRRAGRGGDLPGSTVAASKSSSLTTPLVSQPLEAGWLAELMAYEGHHQEAAKVYARAGNLKEAIRLFTDLRRWEDAKMFARNAGQEDVSDLTVLQAKWLQETHDWKGASELFVSMGQFSEAAHIIGDNEDVGWQDALLEVVRACPAENAETLEYCGEKFSGLSELHYARETFTKSREISKLMALYAKRQMWKEAAKLADENEGKFDVSIFLSYAEWLVSQDRYEEAMAAFKKSKRGDLARKVLEELTHNAVAECRFKDAAYYFWMLSKETEQEAGAALSDEKDKVVSLSSSSSFLQFEYEHKADLYFAYANVHAYVTDPFTSHQPEMLFQVARFIINSLGSAEVVPFGISKASTLFTLARQAMILGAFKLARHAYDRLSKLSIPERKVEEVEVDMLLVQAKPMRDAPDHLPVCYRCSSTNPLLNPFTNKMARGDVCTNCGHPFVRSFINFDILPLVEFVPEPSISDEEAIELIRQTPPNSLGSLSGQSQAKGGGKKSGVWKESKDGAADTLTFGGGAEEDEEDALHEAMGVNLGESDLFTRCLNLTLEKQVGLLLPPSFSEVTHC